MADYNLSVAELALGYFEGTTIKPDGSVIAGYNNSMGDLLHEWTLNYLDSEEEKDRIGSLTLTRNGGVSKTPDGQTGWAATLDGTGTLTASYTLPQEVSVLIAFKRSTTGTMGLVHVTDQLKVWIDTNALLNIWFKDNSGVEHTYTGATAITNDAWHQITVGIANAICRVTLDGNLEIDQTAQSWTGLYQPNTTTQDVFSGDGTTTVFNLSHGSIVQGSVTVTVDGVQQTEDTDYTVDYSAGTITFTTAPAAGTNNIVVDYSYYTTGTFTIGSDGTNYFTGQIDRIKIYNRVLGQQDATDEFNWNCILGDFPAKAYYRTPWFKLAIGNALFNYTWTETNPSGTSLINKAVEGLTYQSTESILNIATTQPSGAIYGNVVRALASDTYTRNPQYQRQFATSTDAWVSLEFEFTQA